ncbi:MAG: putative quinol monooxygenase [Paracoccaceae bacterium]
MQEPGCQRFDVWQDPADPARVCLYEVYNDRAAFDAHLVSAHFKAFDAEVASWVMDKQVESGVISQA